MAYSLKKATTWNLLGYIYLLIASFVTTPGLIQALGISDFSRYALYLGIAAIISSLDLGLSRSLVYHMVQEPSSWRQIYRAGLLLSIILAIISLILVSLIVAPSLGLLVASTYILSHGLSYPESQGNFALVNVRNWLVGTANTIGALLVARAGWGVDGVMLALTLATLITWIIVRQSAVPTYDQPILHSLLKYGIGSQLGKLVGQLQGNYAKFILAQSPMLLAAYSIGSSLVTKLVGGITQASTALFPLSVANKNTPELRRVYLHVQFFLILLGIMALMIYQLIGFPFLIWWLKDVNLATNVHQFLNIYRWYALLMLVTPVASTIVDAHGHTYLTSFIGIIAFIIEVSVALYLYPRYGFVSLPVASLISYVLLVTPFLWLTNRILNGFKLKSW